MRVVLILAGTAIAVAAFPISVALQGPVGPPNDKPQQESRPRQQQNVPRAVISNGKSSVELRIVTTTYNRKVLTVLPEQGIGDLTWSPNHLLLAFETFDRQGHSPMTTTHVWVVKADGTGCTQVLLRPPNERLSTHIGGWVTQDALRVLSEVPDRPAPLKYLYLFNTKTVSPENTP